MNRFKQAILITFLLAVPISVTAEIILDGSLGSGIGSITGPDYQVTANLGQQRGDNLFHSFSRFNLEAQTRATFSGPDNIRHLISRVTGGQASSIEGTIRSTMPLANVYLLNPAGIFFGERARLDVSGSFHASTAAYLKFQDNSVFDTGQPESGNLSSAPPAAFGFIGQAGPISLNHAGLLVDGGHQLSLIGGDLSIQNNTVLLAPSGTLQLASLNGAGEIPLQLAATDRPQNGGNIQIADSAFSVSGNPAGSVWIRSGQFDMQRSRIFLNNQASDNPASTSKLSTFNAQVQNFAMNEGSLIQSSTLSQQSGSEILINASNEVSISGMGVLEDGSLIPGGIFNQVGEDSNASGGLIQIQAQNLALSDGAQINSSSFGAGPAGDIQIQAANQVQLMSNATGVSSILSNTRSTQANAGQGGQISIQAQEMNVYAGSQVLSSSFGAGEGGNISIQAGRLEIMGEQTGSALSSALQSTASAAGDAGQLVLNVDNLTLAEGAHITADTQGIGKGGSIAINASDSIQLDGQSSLNLGSFIAANTQGKMSQAGDAGDIDIRARRLELNTGGQVVAASAGPGAGGKIYVSTQDTSIDGVDLSGFGSGILSTASTDDAGPAGDIILESDTLALFHQGQIDASTFGQQSGGNVHLALGDALSLQTNAAISASSGSAENMGAGGKAGHVEIVSPKISLDEQGFIAAQTFSAGDAGNVKILTQNIQLSSGGNISVASHGAGDAGILQIATDNLRMSDSGSRLSAQTASTGKAGGIALTADNIDLNHGAAITASTLGAGAAGDIALQTTQLQLDNGSAIRASTAHAGKGGNVLIQAKKITLQQGAQIQASSLRGIDTPATTVLGEAGEIRLSAGEVLLVDAGLIQTATDSADGGDIIVTLPKFLYILNQGEISTSVKALTGDGGDITLKSDFVVMKQSKIIAQAVSGDGGHIQITTKGLFDQGQHSLISASSEFGMDGLVDIKSPDGDTLENVLALPTDFNAKVVIQNRCGSAAVETTSHFIALRYHGSPNSGNDWRSSGLPPLNWLQETTPPPVASSKDSRHLAQLPVFSIVCSAAEQSPNTLYKKS